MKNCWLTLTGCVFLILLVSFGPAETAGLPAAPEAVAEAPAATPELSETLDALFTFDEAPSSRAVKPCTHWEYRCVGTSCEGYGQMQQRCTEGSGGSWENGPLLCC